MNFLYEFSRTRNFYNKNHISLFTLSRLYITPEYYDEEGLKTAYWKSLYEDGSIDYEGAYLKDALQGEWKWYFRNGQMSAREVYDNDKLKKIEFWNENGKKVKGKLKSETMPEFPGGQKQLFAFLSKEVLYPPEARNKEIQVMVYVKFTINEDGTLSDLRLAISAHPLLDAEALRVIKKMPRWTPGKHLNRPLKMAYTLPFKFNLVGK